jgi:high-affinity Fe2+/Pb2+ permease
MEIKMKLNMKDRVFCVVIACMLLAIGYCALHENKGEKAAKEYIRHGDITYYEYQ